MMQVPFTVNQLRTMQMKEEVSEGMNYPEVPDSSYKAQPVHNFLFPWEEEMESTENLVTIDEDEGCSETMISQTPLPNNHQQWNLLKLCALWRTFRTFLLLDSSLIEYFCKQLIFDI